jgi:anti-anti-sigma factor
MEPSSSPEWSSKLRLDRADQANGTTRLTVEGDVDMSTGDHFHQTVMDLAGDPAVTRLLVDVAGLNFIDSNGITVLVKAHRAASERGTPFAIINVQDNIRGLLEMLDVYDLLTTAYPA